MQSSISASCNLIRFVSVNSHLRSRAMPEARANAVSGGKVKQQVPAVLTIAGSDSGGGAGIQADLKTLAANGVFGTSATTALTAQNTKGVSSIHSIPAAFVAEQIAAVLEDIPIDVVKTGMLPSVEIVAEVARAVGSRPHLQLVVDPVLVTTSGHNLATTNVGRAIAQQLFPLATVVTPNLSEASVLLDGVEVRSLEAMETAARALHKLGPKYVLVKGGHLQVALTVNCSQPAASLKLRELHGMVVGWNPIEDSCLAAGDQELADVLFDGQDMLRVPGPRILTNNTHGTGCTTASAIAAFLAKGLPAPEAVTAAREYVTEALRRSAHLQIGSGKQRPFNHLFAIDEWRASDGRQSLDLRLYAVTDSGCNLRCGRSNAEAVAAAVEGGSTTVQLREKDTDGGNFCREAEAVLAVTRPRGVKLLINDRIDVALAVGADGVHVGQDDIPARLARRLLGADGILGVSVKNVEEARQAEADGADYLGAGAVNKTATKDSSTITLETLSEICRAVKIPVVAIGGITASNAASCIEAGCAGVAVVSAIFGADNPREAASEIMAAVSS